MPGICSNPCLQEVSCGAWALPLWMSTGSTSKRPSCTWYRIAALALFYLWGRVKDPALERRFQQVLVQEFLGENVSTLQIHGSPFGQFCQGQRCPIASAFCEARAKNLQIRCRICMYWYHFVSLRRLIGLSDISGMPASGHPSLPK